MRLLLVRHSDPNYELDCLTELGHKQAEVVAKRLMEEGIQKIFCSPQGRAHQTAKPFAELSGLKEIETLDFMRELRFGHIPHTCITALRFDRRPGALSMPLLEYAVDARHLNVFNEGMTGSVERAQSQEKQNDIPRQYN